MARRSRRFTQQGFTSLRRFTQLGFTSLRRSAQQGFTLVELMVVITLVALLAAVVVVSFPDPQQGLRADAERFAARARAAHDLAIVEARTISLWVNNSGYGFDIRSHDGWMPITEKPFRTEHWGGGTQPRFDPPGAQGRVVFDTTGLADAPLDLALDRPGAAPVRVVVSSDGTVSIHA